MMQTPAMRLARGDRWPHRVLGAAVLLAAAWQPAHAQLFGDNEARRAILDLRQRYQSVSDENTRLRSSLLELQTQIESLRGDVAKANGRQEQLARELADVQQHQKELAAAAAAPPAPPVARARPAAADDADEGAAPAGGDNREKAAFDAALNQFRSGDYAKARTSLRGFLKTYPQSSQRVAAQFWLGNSEYALRNYRGALAAFRSVIAQAPDHERAPEAMLSIANCQIELHETAAARASLEQLVAKYPRSEAAQAGRDRLARLK